MQKEIGVNKAFLPFGGKNSLVAYQIDSLSSYFDNIYLSAKEPKFGTAYSYIYDVTQLHNIDLTTLFAPTLSLYSVLLKIQQDTLFIPIDMPLISIQTLKKLLDLSLNNHQATVLRVDGKIYPTCAVYKPSILSNLEQMIIKNLHKLQVFLDEIDTIYLDTSSSEEFVNINNYSEYQRICKNEINTFGRK